MITADRIRILGKVGNSLSYELAKIETKIILYAAGKSVKVECMPSFQKEVIANLKASGFEVKNIDDFNLLISW